MKTRRSHEGCRNVLKTSLSHCENRGVMKTRRSHEGCRNVLKTSWSHCENRGVMKTQQSHGGNLQYYKHFGVMVEYWEFCKKFEVTGKPGKDKINYSPGKTKES